MRANVVSSFFCVLVLFPVAACAAPGDGFGIYSTLTYNKESGDLNGIEVSIAGTDGGLVASVQIAENGVNELHLANIEQSAETFLFSIRLDDGVAVDFSMRCSPKSCIGEYAWGKAIVKFTLPKSNGYWNKK